MHILYLAITWFIGLWLASHLLTQGETLVPIWSGPVLLWALLAGIVVGLLAGFGLRRRRAWLIPFLVAVFLLALLRYQLALPTVDEGHVSYYNGAADVTLIGLVAEEPVVRDNSIRATLSVASITLPGVATRAVAGKIITYLPPDQPVAYGMRLRLAGDLEAPPVFDTFDYRQYLARQGVHSALYQPDILLLAVGEGNPVRAAILRFKARLQAGINTYFPEPAASLLSGILLGNEAGIPETLRQDFRVTGMTHIIAISGFNITILAGVLLALVRPLAGRRLAPWLAMTGIALYTVLVGADASVVRAAIMGGVYLFGSLVLGRSTYHYASLFLAGVFMTAVNPFALWDVGFQLSFAATLGLMAYAGPMQNWTRGWLAARLSPEQTNRLMGWISEGILLTLAAQIPTLPLLVFYFEQLSLVSLLANPLILPAQPYVMIMGGLATLAGAIFPAVGQILAWAAWLGLAYTIQMVEWLAQVPFAAVPVRLEWPGLLLVYGLIAAITYYLALPPYRRGEVRQAAGVRVGWSGFLGVGAVMTLLVVAWGRGQPDGQLHIHFLNVDQGQGLLVQTPAGRHILIDGGASGQQLNVMLGRRLPFWKRTIDVAVAREEPLQGLSAVLARRPAGQLLHGPVIDPLTILPEAAEGSQPLVGGQRLHMGDGVILEVVARESGEPWLRLEHGNLAVWLPDDGEALVLPAGVQPDDAVPLAMVLWGSVAAESDAAGGNVIALETLGNVEMVTDGREIVLQSWGDR